ncbi:hypothetical protein ACW180_09585 [Limosilactobacillus fermentum]
MEVKAPYRVVNNDSAADLRDLRTENSIIISYPDAVATTVFNQTFNESVDTARLKRINHIVMTLDKTPTVCLDGGRKVPGLPADDDQSIACGDSKSPWWGERVKR